MAMSMKSLMDFHNVKGGSPPDKGGGDGDIFDILKHKNTISARRAKKIRAYGAKKLFNSPYN